MENKLLIIALISGVFLTSCSKKFTTEQKDGYVQASNRDGSTLDYHPESDVQSNIYS